MDLADPRNSSTILRLIHSSAQLLITPPSHGVDEFQVAGKVTSKDQVMAVTGACVSRETVASLWKRATGAILERTPLLDESGTNVFWLDEGGHVLQTEDVHVQPGTFLGAAGVQPQLFRSLLLAQPTPLYRKVRSESFRTCGAIPRSHRPDPRPPSRWWSPRRPSASWTRKRRRRPLRR